MKNFRHNNLILGIVSAFLWCSFFTFLLGFFYRTSLYDGTTNGPRRYYYVENGEIKDFSDSLLNNTTSDSVSSAELCIYDYFAKDGNAKFNENKIINNPYTAYTIAMSVLTDKYGDFRVNQENPYKVSLTPNKRYWIVEGTLSGNELGGGISVVINRNNGAIVFQ